MYEFLILYKQLPHSLSSNRSILPLSTEAFTLKIVHKPQYRKALFRQHHIKSLNL